MNQIINEIQWDMHSQAVNEITMMGSPLTSEELDTIVHPSSDWALYMFLNEWALPEQESQSFSNIMSCVCKNNNHQSKLEMSMNIRRSERFSSTATLRQVLERIKGGMAYGQYDGMKLTNPEHYHYYIFNNFGNIPIYTMGEVC